MAGLSFVGTHFFLEDADEWKGDVDARDKPGQGVTGV
jgi:hypothetical protein